MSYTSSGSRHRVFPSQNEEIQLRVDPINADLDEQIHGMRDKVKLLRNVAQDIQTETKYQNELLNELEGVMLKAQAGLKSTMGRLNRALAQRGVGNLMRVIYFALFFTFVVYLMKKFFK